MLRKGRDGIVFNEHLDSDGAAIFKHACKLGLEGIVSKRLGSPYRSGRSHDWLKFKNPEAPAVKREAEEDWLVRRQRSLDRPGGLNKGEFLAHRNVHRSEDETANPTIEGTG